MADYDFFDLTGLTFDPPEKNGKKIKAAIDKAEKDLEGMMGSVSQQAEKDEINDKRSMLAELRSKVLSEDNKATEYFKQLADERTNDAKKRLEALIKIEKSGKEKRGEEYVITNGQITESKKSFHLSKESVESVYKALGFSIVNIDPLAAMPKFPVNSEKTFKEIETLRKSKDPNPNGADLTLVYDLYGFVAYLKGEPECASEYQGMHTDDIARILDEYTTNNSMRNDPLGKLCNSIATAGKTNVFNNESNRKAYDLFLKYKSPELVELYSIIKDADYSNRYNPHFADECIERIEDVFSDSDIALAIYNNEAGLRNNPYIWTEPHFTVKCEHCNHLSKFLSYEESRRVNKCAHCGRNLYKECPHCKKMIMSSVNRCPECGFIISNIGLFSKNISHAETALKQGRLDEAREYLTIAKNANPSENEQTADIERQLEIQERMISEPLQRLRVLMTRREYEAAKEYLSDIAKKYPQISLVEQRKEIDSVLDKCRSMFSSGQVKSLFEKMSICMEILDLCVDFRQANEYVSLNPPQRIEEVHASFDGSQKKVVLNWSEVKEPGVFYCVLRKEGTSPSLTINDGTMVSDDITSTSLVDDKIASGKEYVYSVFVKRCNTLSKQNSVLIKTLSAVSDIKYWQNERDLVLSWRLPENCIGASVSYNVDGNNILLTENAHESAEIKNVKYGSPYALYITANYGKLGQSSKSCVTVTPTPVIKSFSISVGQIKEGACNVSWSIVESGVDVQILANGIVVENLRSERKNCMIKLSPNNHYAIQVKAFSGGEWIPSANEVFVNTYEPVLIDEKNSEISEKPSLTAKGMTDQVEIRIKLADRIPGNVKAFYCVIKTKEPGTTKAPWATEDEVGSGADRIDIETYMQWKEIRRTITSHGEEAFYVTLFSVYEVDGKEVLSPPCKKKYSRHLNANVFWNVSKSFFGAKLTVDIEANIPISRRPEMVLCVSPLGKPLLSENDSSAKEILRIPEEVFDDPVAKMRGCFEIKSPVSKNEKAFLFVTDPSENETFSVRWASGFNGKI